MNIQDGNDAGVARVVNEEFGRFGVQLVQRRRSESFSEGAEYIALQYKFMLSRVFDRETNHPYAIVFEDDMEFSPDVLEYFAQLAPLLDGKIRKRGRTVFSLVYRRFFPSSTSFFFFFVFLPLSSFLSSFLFVCPFLLDDTIFQERVKNRNVVVTKPFLLFPLTMTMAFVKWYDIVINSTDPLSLLALDGWPVADCGMNGSISGHLHIGIIGFVHLVPKVATPCFPKCPVFITSGKGELMLKRLTLRSILLVFSFLHLTMVRLWFLIVLRCETYSSFPAHPGNFLYITFYAV